MGMFSYDIKMRIAGRETSDDPGVWVLEGIDRSGVTGVVMELNNTLEKISSNSLGARAVLGINEQSARFYSRSVAEGLLGPTFGSGLTSAISVSNALTSTDELTDSDIRTIRRLLPMQNLFYLRKGFDELEKAIVD